MTEESSQRPAGIPGVDDGGSHFKANLPDMPADNVFVFGQPGQVSQFLKAEKGLFDWIGRNSTNEMFNYIKKGVAPTFPEPKEPAGDKPDDKPSTAQLEKYKMQLKMSMEKEEKFTQDKGRLFRSIKSLCSPALQHKLEANTKYPPLDDAHDLRGLMDLIKEIVYGTDEGKEPYWTMQAAMVKLHTIYQQDRESTGDFHDRFNAQLKVTESIWGPLTPSVMKGKPTAQQDEAREAYLARLFLRGLNQKRFSRDIEDLGNDYVSGNDNYPKDVASALSWITNRSSGKQLRPNQNKRNNAHNAHNTDDEGADARSFQHHQQPTQSQNDDDNDDGSTGSQSTASGHTHNQGNTKISNSRKSSHGRISWAT